MKLGYFIRIAENNQSTLLEGETRNGCYVCPFVQSCRRSKDAETRGQRLKRFYPPPKKNNTPTVCGHWRKTGSK